MLDSLDKLLISIKDTTASVEMTATDNIKGVITTPNETFKQIIEGDHKFIIPIDIIIGLGIIKGIANFVQRPKILETISYLRSIMETKGLTVVQEQMLNELVGMQNITIFDSVSTGIQSAFFGWAILVLVYFIISRLLNGDAGFKDLLEVVGYARVPEVIGALLAIFLASFNPFFVSFMMLLFTLWSRVLDVFAIKEANNFSIKKAAVIVVTPIALFLVLSIITAFLIIGV